MLAESKLRMPPGGECSAVTRLLQAEKTRVPASRQTGKQTTRHSCSFTSTQEGEEEGGGRYLNVQKPTTLLADPLRSLPNASLKNITAHVARGVCKNWEL